MSEDLITNNFVEEVNKKNIKSNILFSKILFAFLIFYTTTRLYIWFVAFQIISEASSTPDVKNVKYYMLIFIIEITVLLISIYGSVLLMLGSKLIKTSFEEIDYKFFNQGYKKITIATFISIITFILSTVSTLIQFIKK